MLLRALFIWPLMAVVEMAHGIIRAKFPAPRIGDLRSWQIAVFTGRAWDQLPVE
jgi:hypothetical protein